MSKLYTHDCDLCIYLGTEDGHDLYLHISEHNYASTLIARFGILGDYTSGFAFAFSTPILNKALKIAVEKQLVPPRVMAELMEQQKSHLQFTSISAPDYGKHIAKRFADAGVEQFLLEEAPVEGDYPPEIQYE